MKPQQMKPLVKSTINKTVKQNLLVVFSLPALAIIASCLYFFLYEHQSSIDLFDSNYSAEAYTDEYDNGKSRVLSFNYDKNGIEFDYQIFPDVNNYAGFNILFNDSIKELLSNCNQVKIKLSTQNLSSLSFIIKTIEDQISIDSLEATHRVNYHLINAIEENKPKEVVINFDDFGVKDWWVRNFAKNLTIPEQPNWKNISKFSVIKENEVNPQLPSQISIHKITLIKNSTRFFIFVFITISLSLIASFLILTSKRNTIEVTYQGINGEEFIKDKKDDAILNYIGKAYRNSDLKISDIAKHTGVSAKEVPILIKEKSGRSFKQILNDIRIAEGKKLLIETNLSVKEICYEIGYSLPNHFRRVFKQYENVSPSDFRKQNQPNRES